MALTIAMLAAAGCFAACSDDPSSAPPLPPQNQSAKERLEADTGTSWLVELDPTFGTVRFAMPRGYAKPLSAKNQTREDAVVAFVQKYDAAFHLGATGLKPTSTTLDDFGGAHVTFAETLGGVPVHGGQITVHLDLHGSVTYINGLWIPASGNIATTGPIDGKRAIAIAEADMAKIPGFSQASELAQISRHEIDPYIGKVPQLVVQVYISAPFASRHYEIDAQSGKILKNESSLYAVSATGKGIAFYATNANHNAGDIKSFSVDSSGVGDGGAEGGAAASYTMHAARNGSADELTVYDFNEGNPRFVVNSSDVNSWDTKGNGPGSAVDAYVTMAKVDKFFADVFKRKSYDGKGAKVDVVVHHWDPRNSLNAYLCNAYFEPNGLFMLFGDGDWRHGIGPIGGGGDGGVDGGVDGGGGGVVPGPCYPLAAALDVVAHEYTHAIVYAELNLDGGDEAGAMDESFADIFGGFCEHHDDPDDTRNTEIGEQGWIRPGNTPLRSAKDPSLGLEYNGKEPDHYSKLDPSNERHVNSTIPSHAMYLMTLGGTNKTSKIPVKNPLGWDDSQKLWYAILTQSHISSSAKFADEAKASLAQAKTLGLKLEPVACAWVATGVLDNAFVRDNFNVLCACPGQDGGPPQDPSTFACCDPNKGSGGDGGAEQCCKLCSEAGTEAGQPEGAPPQLDGDSPDVQLFDSCAGRADGVYCSGLQPFSSIVCKGGSIAGGQQCPANQTCAGPNGPGDSIQCH